MIALIKSDRRTKSNLLRLCIAIILTLGVAAAANAQMDLSQPIVVPVKDLPESQIHHDLVYREADPERNLADIFLPANSDTKHPTVIFVHGGPVPPSMPLAPKDWGIYQSYGALMANAGFAAIVFNHRFYGLDHLQTASDDIQAVTAFVRSNADKYAIDKDNVCLWIFSGGSSFVAPFLSEGPEWLKCMAIYYSRMGPLVMDSEGTSSNAANKAFDPIAALEAKSNWDPGLFIAEAGADNPTLNAGLRRFVQAAIENAWKVEYWNHPTGPHAFDLLQDDERSRAIILRTVDFLGEQLGAGAESE